MKNKFEKKLASAIAIKLFRVIPILHLQLKIGGRGVLQFCDVAQVVIIQQNDIAKFGYKNGSKRIEVSFYIFGYPA